MKHESNGHWGDLLKRKKSNCTRVLLHNSGGIGFVSGDRNKESLKMERVKQLTIKYNFDLICLTEVNKDWRAVSQENTIWNATAGWQENRRVQVSFNKSRPCTNEYVVGGTAMVSFNDIVFRISKQGADDRNLGRWSYVTITGKNAITSTIITCYCPVISSSPGSVYSQHLLYMSENKSKIPTNIICPRQLFGHDLKEMITKYTAEGHNVILQGDFNSDYEHLNKWMNELGLVDLVNKKHGQCPITYQRSFRDPLDCVFGDPYFKIKNGGCLSFNRLISDHRGIWFDIPNECLLGFNPTPICHANARRLKTKDPRCVTRYCDKLDELCVKSQMYERMNQLHTQVSHPLQQHQIELYEEMDEEICCMMDKAEISCRQLHMGKVSWSPTYKNVSLEIEYWRMRRSHFLGLHRNVRQLIILQNKLKIKYNDKLTLAEIDGNIRSTYKKRKKIKEMATSLSLEYRTKLALAREEAGEVKAASYIKSLNLIEQQRRMYQNIKVMENRIRSGTTSRVTITSADGSVKEYVNKREMENIIAKSNEIKYHATEGGSQLHQKAFIDKLGTHGEGPSINKVLQGTFTYPDNCSQDTKDFLDNCQYAPKVMTVKENTSIRTRYQNHVKSWLARRESTCTYGQHVGHYRAVNSHTMLSWLFFQRGNIPVISSYAPVRHRKCVDLMILKKSATYELSSQRTLGILDTEFNHNNGFIGRQATYNGIKLGTIADEQFSRPNRSAIEDVITKRCTIDHQQSIRQCFAITSVDLTSCYDRIVHTAAALALLRIGISHSRVKSMFNAIQKMVHRIRTLHGDSEVTYGGELGEWENWPQGVLQGNAAGPAIWSTLSSVIFKILHKRGFSSRITSSISKQLFCIVGYAYVDDCDLFQVGNDPIAVLSSMQSMINSWGGLMKVTGAEVRTDKCWWYLLDYVWKRGRWICVDSELATDLVATKANGEKISLKRLRMDEAAEMLGVYLAPDGNTRQCVDVLKRKSLEWATKVKMGHPSRLEAWTALQTNMSPRLKYPLAACTLSEKECRSIMFPAIKAALPKSGVSSTIETSIRDGPIASFGCGVWSLFHFMSTTRTACMVEQLTHDTPLGQIIRINIEDIVTEAGLYGSVWKMDVANIKKYISTHSWVYATLEYNHSNNISIHISHDSLQPQRVHDQSLMCLASKYTKNSSDIRAINRVRMLYQVIHLSDITMANGRSIESQFLTNKNFHPVRNSYNWPHKHKVTSTDYTTWRRFLRWIYSATNLHLVQPLGSWLHKEEWVQTWCWFVSSCKQYLYHQMNETTWHRHLLHEYSHHTFYVQFMILHSAPDDTLLRASVKETKHDIQLLNSSIAIQTYTTPDPEIHTYADLNIHWPSPDWFMKNITHSRFTSKLNKSLHDGSALAVSDGSYYPLQQVGSCGWIISSADGMEWIQGGGIIPGEAGDQSSYRSELGGLVGIIAFLNSVQMPELSVAPQDTITILCDGKSALDKIGVPLNMVKSKVMHSDLISILSHLTSNSNFHLIKEHVKAHQDEEIRPLSMKEYLNCKMDALAKKIAIKYMTENLKLHFPHTTMGFGTVSCNGNLITSRLQKSLYHNITQVNHVKRLAQILNIPLHILKQSVNWKVLSSSRKEVSHPVRVFMTKWISGDTATGTVMVRRKQRLSAQCPLCSYPQEDTRHILQCPSTSTQSLRHRLLKELQCWLSSVDTHPEISDFLVKGLTSWLTPNCYFSFDSSVALPLQTAFLTQLQLGWEALLLGFLTTPLLHCQHSYYHSQGSRKSGNRWGIRLTAKLWNIIFQLWHNRNQSVHDKAFVDRVSGQDQLKTAIILEHALGIQTLPSVYHSYFGSLPNLQSQSVKYQKQWFLVIRTARESCGSFRHYDNFSIIPTLRTWIGLSPL